MEELKEDYPQRHLDLHGKKENKFQRISCPSCGTAIPASDLNINDKIAKCGSCNAVFSFQENILSMLQDTPKQEHLRPEGIELFYFKDELDITVQQPMTPLEIILVSIFPFFAFLFSLGLIKGKIDVLIPAILWAISLVTFASLLFRKKHKIYITVDEDDLSVQWRPKKLIKDKKFNSKDIDQVYVKHGNELNEVYIILNTDKGQKHVKLLGGFKSLVKAKFLEQEIEKHLNIENRKVIGEIS